MIATLLTTLCREVPPRCIRIGSRDNSRDKVSREATRRIRESRQNPDTFVGIRMLPVIPRGNPAKNPAILAG